MTEAEQELFKIAQGNVERDPEFHNIVQIHQA
jgi:hypothetical protein